MFRIKHTLPNKNVVYAIRIVQQKKLQLYSIPF